MAHDPRLPPGEAEGYEDKVPHERVEHQPRWNQLGKAAAGELADVLELRVKNTVLRLTEVVVSRRCLSRWMHTRRHNRRLGPLAACGRYVADSARGCRHSQRQPAGIG